MKGPFQGYWGLRTFYRTYVYGGRTGSCPAFSTSMVKGSIPYRECPISQTAPFGLFCCLPDSEGVQNIDITRLKKKKKKTLPEETTTKYYSKTHGKIYLRRPSDYGCVSGRLLLLIRQSIRGPALHWHPISLPINFPPCHHRTGARGRNAHFYNASNRQLLGGSYQAGSQRKQICSRFWDT
jgi:hypothetical protein